MAELQTTGAVAGMLALQPQLHDIWLDISKRGGVEGVGGSDGSVGAASEVSWSY
jgi:hypothetical protein